MQITSQAFTNGGKIPDKYTMYGENKIPPIHIEQVPEKARSLALIVDDPDAPKGTYVHWVMWNIPATATSLPEGVPKGAQRPDGSYQVSATGPMYRGPGAPATGPRHHYMFELYALDTKLDVQPAADAFETRTNVMKAMQGHILGKAVYGGLFRRPQ